MSAWVKGTDKEFQPTGRVLTLPNNVGVMDDLEMFEFQPTGRVLTLPNLEKDCTPMTEEERFQPTGRVLTLPNNPIRGGEAMHPTVSTNGEGTNPPQQGEVT